MRIVRNLSKLQQTATRRLLKLKSFAPGVGPVHGFDDDQRVSFVSIELVNLWSEFCRFYFISCALGVRGMKGGRVLTTTPLNTKEEAITFAVVYKNPKKTGNGPWTWLDEPTWRRPTTILNLLTRLGASNVTQVQAAFGYSTVVFDHLPTVRNFFCHRNEGTSNKLAAVARAVKVPPKARAIDIVCSASPTGTQSILREWIDDLRLVVEDLCQ